jgi:hypothetical protein
VPVALEPGSEPGGGTGGGVAPLNELPCTVAVALLVAWREFDSRGAGEPPAPVAPGDRCGVPPLGL